MINNYSLSFKLERALRKKNISIALAESCTGGGLAYEITAVPGSSEHFEGGFVTYSNESKQQMLGVKVETLEKFGAVSEETAKEMALGVLANSKAAISLSITGIAGPSGGSAEKPVGMVCFGLAIRDGECETKTEYLTGGRKNVRRMAITVALEWLLSVVED